MKNVRLLTIRKRGRGDKAQLQASRGLRSADLSPLPRQRRQNVGDYGHDAECLSYHNIVRLTLNVNPMEV